MHPAREVVSSFDCSCDLGSDGGCSANEAGNSAERPFVSRTDAEEASGDGKRREAQIRDPTSRHKYPQRALCGVWRY